MKINTGSLIFKQMDTLVEVFLRDNPGSLVKNIQLTEQEDRELRQAGRNSNYVSSHPRSYLGYPIIVEQSQGARER